ncbi:MAG TPA: malto-oligosyltrehalose synthase [Polyangiaceae bacterium]|nr:malto-oligosyltrehalose synthase [Polyangiaceae bacterium]
MTSAKVATYRVQLRPEFGFEMAAALADYWAKLGVSHLYTSPYLQAASGSAHGYDVVDHNRVNEELGGELGRQRLCRSLQEHQLKQILDIVPNHMSIRGGHNAWWWDVLENGPSSQYSSYFDVEWQAAEQDKVLLPVLGDQYGVELEEHKIQLKRDGTRFLVEYYEHQMPLAPRSLGRVLREAAKRPRHPELAFLADAFFDLPLPNATDRESRRRRHRDKQVLTELLERLLAREPELGESIDAAIESINADADRLHELLERQNYRITYWRFGNHELDYRRFFDIDSLVGLRVEDEEVFAATHELPLSWIEDGSIAGLRVDHIDGLYDPRGYLERLKARAPEAWILVEKILEGDEQLQFSVSGTTGYDFLNHVQRLLVSPEGEPVLSEFATELDPETSDSSTLARTCKRLVLEQALGSDVKRLCERLVEICARQRRYRDFSRFELTEGLMSLCIAFPVYRTYLRPGDAEPSPRDRAVLREAREQATLASPLLDPRLFEFLERLLLFELNDSREAEFVMRWQQLTGPAMAKGLEDTVFYRHTRLVALNEVGGDPGHFSESPGEFHAWLRTREQCEPYPLNATSTHDTKRSEDVRARLLVLSEVAERWRAAVRRWRQRLAPTRSSSAVPGLAEAPDAGFEYLLLQNLVGAWPIDNERMRQYAEKAMREAKRFSSWHQPNEPYEQAVFQYLDRLYRDRELVEDIEAFVASIRDAGYANSLNQVLLKTLAPGVPDIYQGTELWDFSLVDPDNRRPVDYALRRNILAELDRQTAGELWHTRADGRIKMFVLRRTLALRAQRPECFEAGAAYTPLEAVGPRADRVVAFQRGPEVIGVATRWFARFGNDFGGTTLSLPPGMWRNVLTNGPALSGEVSVTDVLGPLPTAALEKVQG